jgi:hypothetical protein
LALSTQVSSGLKPEVTAVELEDAGGFVDLLPIQAAHPSRWLFDYYPLVDPQGGLAACKEA